MRSTVGDQAGRNSDATNHRGPAGPTNRITDQPGRRPNRLVLSIAAVIGLVLLYTILLEWRGLFRMHFVEYDYAFFYYAFHQVLTHKASFHNLYDIRSQFAWLRQLHYPVNPDNQYVYPPQFAVLFSPFGILPFRVSAILWIMASMLSYFGGVWLLVRLLWGKIRRSRLLGLFVIAAAMTPFAIDAGAGNINSILFFLIVFAFYQLHRHNRPRLAGVALGLTILMKVTPGAVLLVLIFRKQWRVSIWSAITVVVGTVVTSLIVGFDPMWQYALHFMTFGQTSMKNGPAPYNQSIVGVVGMLQQHGWLFGGKTVQDIAFLGFVAWAARAIYVNTSKHAPVDWRLDMALACLSPLLFSPLDEQMHMLMVIPALMVFARLAAQARGNHGTGSVVAAQSNGKRWPQSGSTLLHQSAGTRPQGADVLPARLDKRLAWRLTAVIGVCVGLLSLPATFAFNTITGRWPMLAWLHTQMFVVLVVVLVTLLALYRHARSLQRTRPRDLGEFSPARRGSWSPSDHSADGMEG